MARLGRTTSFWRLLLFAFFAAMAALNMLICLTQGWNAGAIIVGTFCGTVAVLIFMGTASYE